MAKIVEVPFGSFYHNRFSKPIRDKRDFVLLFLDTLNILINGKCEQNECGKIVIKIDKMSRAFYQLENKFYSVIFPFYLEKKEDVIDCYSVYASESDRAIDSRMISVMRTIMETWTIENISVEEILEKIYFAEAEYTEQDIQECCSILFYLFSAEVGYIRYDYDLEHEKGDLHPLNHLDINYSSKCTYKLGLKEKIELDNFIDIVDIQTNCKYVV